MAEIETNKIVNQITAIGRDTLIQMARAGPEMQTKLLKGLGLKGFMITNSKNPINLF